MIRNLRYNKTMSVEDIDRLVDINTNGGLFNRVIVDSVKYVSNVPGGDRVVGGVKQSY